MIEATATKKAEKGIRNLKVLKLASTHKIATDTVDGSEKLSAAKFSIEVNGDKRSIRFRGGTLKALRNRIQEEASEIIGTNIVNTSANNYVMTIQSKIPGKKGEIILRGDKDLLEKVGLSSGEKGAGQDSMDLIFDRKYFTTYTGEKKPEEQTGSIEVKEKGRTVSANGIVWQEYTLPLEAQIKKETLIEFDFAYKTIKEKEKERIPFRVEIGPDEKINVKGIELRGYNVSRIRPLEKKKKKVFDSVLGVGVAGTEKGKRFEKIYNIEKDSKAKQEIPIGRDFEGKKINRIILYCNEGITDFSDLKIVTRKKGKGFLQPKNEIAKAENARLSVDGIEIEREKNNDLKNVIKGLSLNLKGKSLSDVSLKVEPDVEKSINNIKKFVEAYNNYLDYHKKLIKTEKITKPGDYGKNKFAKGLFVGDMTIIRLESSLKRVVNSAYPSRAEQPIRILPQMGVSTGALNADWEAIKEGKLVVDESKLRTEIWENPEGIKSFFGSDTDGDNKTDSGMAFSLVNHLKPYIGYGRNIISTKVNVENDLIKSANDKIERQRQHLAKYEEKLRAKFATMEKAISGAKAQQNWMKAQGGGGNKDK